LIVGGYAVSFHAQRRATKDLDILVSADEKNSEAVFAALAEFGVPVGGLSARDFAKPGAFFRMGAPPAMADILPSISGVEFEKAWSKRVMVPIDESLTAPFISREDLRAAKLASGRPQDLAFPHRIDSPPSRARLLGGEVRAQRPKAPRSFLATVSQQVPGADLP
jgi:hypothetical protein